MRGTALAVALALVLAIPAAASAGDAAAVKGSVRLSNESTSTRWAHPTHRAPIRRLPNPHARKIASTHALTEDGFPEVYVVLRGWDDPAGHSWLEVRIPMRPNGRTGWVRHSTFGPLYRVRTLLVVDRAKLRATLYRRGNAIWSAPVGIGKRSTPTPAGHFWIREKFRTHDPNGLYGPAAFGSSDYSVLSDWPGGGVIGIHGTDEPSLIPGRPSHGCIRLKNPALRRLWRLLPIGTPLLIGHAPGFVVARPSRR
jgi:L,D-transpeptidase-like protein